MVNFLIMIFDFIILIGIIVFFHEGGHFLFFRLMDVKILEFSLGFGPKIYQKKIGKDQTLLTIRILPLGGYVKPLEKNNITDKQFQQLSLNDQKRIFENLQRWKKMAIVFAGPLFNFILSFLVFIIMFFIVGESGFAPKISYVYPNSPFYQSGIQKGDTIESINHQKVFFENEAYLLLIKNLLNHQSVMIETQNHHTYHINLQKVNLNHQVDKNMGFEFEGPEGKIVVEKIHKNSVAFQNKILPKDVIVAFNHQKINDLNLLIHFLRNDNHQKSITLTIDRNQQTKDISLIPAIKYEDGKKIGYIGLDLKVVKPINQKIEKKYSFVQSIAIAREKLVDYTKITLISLKDLLVGKISMNNLSGPVSMIKYSAQSAHSGLFTYLNMLAVISISIGIFNLLPIPLLDGGHLLQYIIESIRQRDFSLLEMRISQTIGLLSIMLIFSISMINDLLKWIHF